MHESVTKTWTQGNWTLKHSNLCSRGVLPVLPDEFVVFPCWWVWKGRQCPRVWHHLILLVHAEDGFEGWEVVLEGDKRLVYKTRLFPFNHFVEASGMPWHHRNLHWWWPRANISLLVPPRHNLHRVEPQRLFSLLTDWSGPNTQSRPRFHQVYVATTRATLLKTTKNAHRSISNWHA